MKYTDWYEEFSNAYWLILRESVEDSIIPEQDIMEAHITGLSPSEALDQLYRIHYEGEEEDD